MPLTGVNFVRFTRHGLECDPTIRADALELFADLRSGELDDYQTVATENLLAEMLFPNGDDAGSPGLDLDEAEEMAKAQSPENAIAIDELDREEELFAVRLKEAMTSAGTTQATLAAKIGVGQPAISMMLSRNCRPQRSTVQKIADALSISPDTLWPSWNEGE